MSPFLLDLKYQTSNYWSWLCRLTTSCHIRKKFKVIAYDVSPRRVQELISGFDKTLEVEKADLLKMQKL